MQNTIAHGGKWHKITQINRLKTWYERHHGLSLFSNVYLPYCACRCRYCLQYQHLHAQEGYTINFYASCSDPIPIGERNNPNQWWLQVMWNAKKSWPRKTKLCIWITRMNKKKCYTKKDEVARCPVHFQTWRVYISYGANNVCKQKQIHFLHLCLHWQHWLKKASEADVLQI